MQKDLRLLGVNAAGIQAKTKSFIKVLCELEPSIFFLEETKSKSTGLLKVKNYVIFEKIRQNQIKGGGGSCFRGKS